jgi:kynurenine formamidase
MTLIDLSAPIRPEPPDYPAFTLRIEGAGGAPARVVAIVPECDR